LKKFCLIQLPTSLLAHWFCGILKILCSNAHTDIMFKIFFESTLILSKISTVLWVIDSENIVEIGNEFAYNVL
jgi:hypothetical protein